MGKTEEGKILWQDSKVLFWPCFIWDTHYTSWRRCWTGSWIYESGIQGEAWDRDINFWVVCMVYRVRYNEVINCVVQLMITIGDQCKLQLPGHMLHIFSRTMTPYESYLSWFSNLLKLVNIKQDICTCIFADMWGWCPAFSWHLNCSELEEYNYWHKKLSHYLLYMPDTILITLLIFISNHYHSLENYMAQFINKETYTEKVIWLC